MTRCVTPAALAAPVLLSAAFALAPCTPVSAQDGTSQLTPTAGPWGIALAWLVPAGLGLLACGAVRPARVAGVIRTGWLALGVSVIGYWLGGFALQFGGLGFVYDQPDLAGLAREWAWRPPQAAWGARWGMLGLEGFMLRGPAATPTVFWLFLSQLPWITTAVAIPLWSLQGRARPFTLFVSGVLLALVYALLGNWTWGGGWLANLGLNLGRGHGFIDWGGAGAIHLAGAASALAGMLAFGVRRPPEAAQQLPLPTLPGAAPGVRRTAQDEPYVPMPPLYLPAMATLGAWLAVVGWMGWVLYTPTAIVAGLPAAAAEMLAGLLLGASGGAMSALLFSWLTVGEGDALMVARGVIGALIATGAGLPFIPLWAALAIGAAAGLLVPVIHYLITHLLRLDDPTSAIATHGACALWGLLAVGLLAGGQAGSGWNGVGTSAYLGVAGQGVTGYLAAAGYAGDWPGQFQAQLAGAATASLGAFFLSWLLFAAVQGLSRAWQGEYTIRLPRRPRPSRPRPRSTARRWPRVHIVRTTPPSPSTAVETAGAGARLSRAWAALRGVVRQSWAAVQGAWRRAASRVRRRGPEIEPPPAPEAATGADRDSVPEEEPPCT